MEIKYCGYNNVRSVECATNDNAIKIKRRQIKSSTTNINKIYKLCDLWRWRRRQRQQKQRPQSNGVHMIKKLYNTVRSCATDRLVCVFSMCTQNEYMKRHWKSKARKRPSAEDEGIVPFCTLFCTWMKQK